MKIKVRKVTDKTNDRWVVDCTPAGGKRQRRFFKTKEEADAAAKEQGGIWRTAGESWVSLTIPERVDLIGAYGRIRGRGLTLNQIIDQWESGQSAAALAAANGVKVMTVRQALDTWLSEIESARTPQTHANYSRWANRFANGCSEMKVTSLTAQMFKDWLSHHTGSSFNTYRNIAKAWTSWMLTNKEITGLQVDPIPRKTIIVKSGTNNERPRILSVPEARTMLSWLWANDRELLAHCVLALFCGIRPEECDRISGWDQIDLERGILRLTDTKTNKPRVIHMEPAALSWLRLARTVNSQIGWNLGTRLARMRKVTAALGLDKWPKDVLRHSFGSYYTELHRSVDRTSHELGNSIAVCKKHYLDAVMPDDCKAFWSLTPEALGCNL